MAHRLRIRRFVTSRSFPTKGLSRSSFRHAALAALIALPLSIAAQPKADAPKANGKAAAGTCARVKLSTSMGAITLQLDREKAPVSAENFQKYVKSGFYDGTIFHRVINDFMIQGGGFTKDMAQKPTQAPIKNEAANGLKNDTYTIAMARTSNPDSATAQFFINVKNNDMLNFREPSPQGIGYAVFGKVVDGHATVDKIKAVATSTSGPHQNVPATPVVIEKAECL